MISEEMSNFQNLTSFPYLAIYSEVSCATYASCLLGGNFTFSYFVITGRPDFIIM